MRKVLPIAAILALLGLSVALYKIFFLNFPLVPDTLSRYWLVEAHLAFQGTSKPVKVEMFLPRTSKQHLLVDESFVSRGYGLSTEEKGPNRIAEWTLRSPTGLQGLYYRALVLIQESTTEDLVKAPPILERAPLDGPLREVALGLLQEARAKSADEVSLARHVLSVLRERGRSGELRPLLEKNADRPKRLAAAVLVLQEAKVVARIVQGVPLEAQARRVEPLARLEVFTGREWQMLTAEGVDVTNEATFLPWWRGDGSLVDLRGGRSLKSTIALRQVEEAAVAHVLRLGEQGQSPLVWVSLLRLPLEMQSVFRMLLLVPVGALVVTILRNVVGLAMPGTFMPVLLALAFRQTSLWWGILIFAFLTVVGLVIRSYLDNLRLLLVPRVSGVLTVVILLMAVVTIVAYEAGLEVAHSVALFPMVVITMNIERTSLLWEEVGPRGALIQWLSGLLGAVIIYYALLSEYLSYFLLVFPETLLIVLGLLFLLGRYTGYRLLELRRFRDLFGVA